MGNNYDGGYGGMFRQWLACDRPQPYNSFGNGSAMRISFIGEHYDNADDVVKFAKQSAAVTHNHPEGVKGAIGTAACASMVNLVEKVNKKSMIMFIDFMGMKININILFQCH